ncbi:MAG TPA: hypothetical protein VLX28_09380, partial [Thermoanaerobaculia bacterium]|nr:hypothetical protein [Thermoanaerobaculia bacterium]
MGTSLQAWTSASELYSYSRTCACRSCTSRSQSSSGLPGATPTRTGSVLMKTPSIVSIPGITAERPDETAPKTT